MISIYTAIYMDVFAAPSTGESCQLLFYTKMNTRILMTIFKKWKWVAVFLHYSLFSIKI